MVLPNLVKRVASSPLSKKIGVLAVEPQRIEVVRWALRSNLVVSELRNKILEKAREALL